MNLSDLEQEAIEMYPIVPGDCRIRVRRRLILRQLYITKNEHKLVPQQLDKVEKTV